MKERGSWQLEMLQLLRDDAIARENRKLYYALVIAIRCHIGMNDTHIKQCIADLEEKLS